jgi:hypothetical protein
MAVEGLNFITGVRYAEGMLKAINSLTFVYDATWEATEQMTTFPIAFFGIKNIKENMASEVQTKKMLFYNSQVAENPAVTTGSILNVVADNIVNKPKTYQMEILVPNVTTGMIYSNPYVQPYQLTSIFTTQKDTQTKTIASNILLSIELLVSVLTFATGLAPSSTLVNFISNTLGNKPMFNKDSLIYMWKNRKVLKLKLWNDWKFKYVTIADVSFSKVPTEDNYETANITFTEVPMAVMYPDKVLGNKIKAVKFGSLASKVVKTTLDFFDKE